MTQDNLTQGIHHVAITVLDLDATVEFFVNALGYDKVGADPSYPAAFVSDGTTMIALWQAKNPEKAAAFDRFNVLGLHHLAIAVDDGKLDGLHTSLADDVGCNIEFPPELAYGGPGRHMMVNIPGSGIRVEFRTP